MKDYADYLPGTHHNIGELETAILLDETVDCEACNQRSANQQVECFEPFHNLIF